MEITLVEKFENNPENYQGLFRVVAELTKMKNCFIFNGKSFEFRYDGSNQYFNQTMMFYGQDKIQEMVEDPSINTFCGTYHYWNDNNRKTYFINSSVLEALKDTKLNFSTTYLDNLPDSGYFVLKTNKLVDQLGVEIDCFLYKKMKIENGDTMVLISYLCKDRSIGFNNFIYNKDEDIEERLNDTHFEIHGIGQEMKVEPQNSNREVIEKFLSLMLLTSDPDLVFKKNTFSDKNSKRVAQIKTLSRLKIAEINVVIPREYYEAEVSVRGHFRFQPYGEGKKMVKLIYISPFTRSQKKLA